MKKWLKKQLYFLWVHHKLYDVMLEIEDDEVMLELQSIYHEIDKALHSSFRMGLFTGTLITFLFTFFLFL